METSLSPFVASPVSPFLPITQDCLISLLFILCDEAHVLTMYHLQYNL